MLENCDSELHHSRVFRRNAFIDPWVMRFWLILDVKIGGVEIMIRGNKETSPDSRQTSP
jgi:hypothetical protein